MITEELLIEIYCEADDFCNEYFVHCKKYLSQEQESTEQIFPKSKMSLSEVMTINILFHLSGYITIITIHIYVM